MATVTTESPTLADDFQAFVHKLQAKKAAQKAALPLTVPPAGFIKEPAPAPTIEEYKALLARHDWFFEFSDDHRVWARGRIDHKKLEQMAAVLDPDRSIWKSYEPQSVAQ